MCRLPRYPEGSAAILRQLAKSEATVATTEAGKSHPEATSFRPLMQQVWNTCKRGQERLCNRYGKHAREARRGNAIGMEICGTGLKKVMKR